MLYRSSADASKFLNDHVGRLKAHLKTVLKHNQLNVEAKRE